MKIKDIITDVSRDLNDQEAGYEFTRWSAEQLQSYLIEALLTDSYDLKDLFHQTVVVKLIPDGNWQDTCECSEILRVIGECTKGGTVTSYLKRTYDDEMLYWSGDVYPKCTDPDEYKPLSYAISETDTSKFRVYPPVPPGVDRYVLIQCYHAPTGESLSENIPDEMVAMLKQWMLYRALIMDAENNATITTIAGAHLTAHDSLLKRAVERRERERVLRERDANNLRAIQNQGNNGVSGRA